MIFLLKRTIMATITERVQRGAALLNEKCPNWQERVHDTGGLNMASSSAGLLEQALGGSYTKGMHDLGLHSHQGYEYGFDIQVRYPRLDFEEENEQQWKTLTDAWKDWFRQNKKERQP